MSMHQIQKKILQIAQTQDLSRLSLREIGRLIDVNHPQKVKHHIEQLRKKKLLSLVGARNLISDLKGAKQASGVIINVPILGKANCGEATLLAEEDLMGYLPVSKSILKQNKNIFALKSVGDSMNVAKIDDKNIEDGDYVIVDAEAKVPKSGDYIVSVIDGCANIKRFYKDDKHRRFVLVSESNTDYPPIFIHEDDMSEYLINGKVIQVIKSFKM
jgi:SOS-response transcriptional repressor LexA